jgi:hypothetical protein
MKKILYHGFLWLAIILSAIAVGIAIFSLKRPKEIKARYTPVVTTPANSGLGDPLKTAFDKVNAGFVDVYDSLGNIYTEAQVRAKLRDSLNARMAAALSLSDYAWLKTDTVYQQNKQVVTQYQLASFGGGGAGVGMYELKGIVDTTAGIPEAGDSLVINTGFVTHPHVLVYRNGVLQYFNSGRAKNVPKRTNTYVFNQSTGTVTVKPVFATGEKLIVHAFDPIIWTSLTPEGGSGGGGGGGGSSLLTNLAVYLKLDETAGMNITDAVGTVIDGYESGTPNQTGILGKAVALDGTTQAITLPYHAAEMPNGAFSVGCWVYLDVLPSVKGHGYYVMGLPQGTAPYNPHRIEIRQSDNKVLFTTTNTSLTEFTVESSAALTISGWYNIVAVNAGSGALKLYINGADVSTSAGTFTGTVYHSISGEICFGNNYGGGTAGLDGTMDECALWIGAALSGSLVTEWYSGGVGKTHPF